MFCLKAYDPYPGWHANDLSLSLLDASVLCSPAPQLISGAVGVQVQLTGAGKQVDPLPARPTSLCSHHYQQKCCFLSYNCFYLSFLNLLALLSLIALLH